MTKAENLAASTDGWKAARKAPWKVGHLVQRRAVSKAVHSVVLWAPMMAAAMDCQRAGHWALTRVVSRARRSAALMEHCSVARWGQAKADSKAVQRAVPMGARKAAKRARNLAV